MRKAKGHLELKLARARKGKRQGSYKCTSSKRKARAKGSLLLKAGGRGPGDKGH